MLARALLETLASFSVHGDKNGPIGVQRIHFQAQFLITRRFLKRRMSRSLHGKGWFWCLKRSFIAKPIANARGLGKMLLFKTFLVFYVLILLLAAPHLVKTYLEVVKSSLQRYFGVLFLYFSLSFVLAMVIEIVFLIKRKRFRVSRIWNVVVFSFSHTLFSAFVIFIYKENLKKWHEDFVGNEICLSFEASRFAAMIFVFVLSVAALFENLRVLFEHV